MTQSRIKNWFEIWLRKKNKKNDHLIENQGLLWKYFCEFFGYLNFFGYFWIIDEN